MRRRWLLFLALAGCSTPPAPPPVAPEQDPALEAALASHMAFDITSFKVGEWALYTQRIDGMREAGFVKYAVVAEEGAALWLEIKVPHEPRPFIIKQKFDRAGKLLEEWRGEPGGTPAQVYPPPDTKKAPPPPRRDSSAAQAAVREEAETIQAAGNAYACTRITTTLTYPGGRTSTMVNWCSKQVPLHIIVGTRSVGGLVRRKFGRLTIELSAHGANAGPELSIPRPSK